MRLNPGQLPMRAIGIWRRVSTGGPYVHEQLNVIVLTVLIFTSIGLVAYAEHAAPSLPLAPLYILPLTLSALVYPLIASIALSTVCWILHEFASQASWIGLQHLLRNGSAFLGYLAVILIVNGLTSQRRQLTELASRQRDELATEIQLGAEVQQSILPRTIPAVSGLDFAARMYPAKTIAGDYYGFIPLGGHETALVIADVAGKGVAAGLLMPSIEIALRMDACRFPGTNDLLRAFNNVVLQVTHGRRFISLFYGKLCHSTNSLQYTNAGHNPPLLLRAGAAPMQLEKGGPVLGLIPDAEYETAAVALQKGDILLLYTDGVVEAENEAGQQYSVERLAALVSSHSQLNANDLIARIHDSVESFRGSRAQQDDITLVVLRVAGGDDTPS